MVYTNTQNQIRTIFKVRPSTHQMDAVGRKTYYVRRITVILDSLIRYTEMIGSIFNPSILIQNLYLIGNIIQTIAIIIGISLVMTGIFRLKKYGEARTYMSYQTSIAGALVLILSGTALLCLPTALSTALLNFWGWVTPLHYTKPSSSYELLIPPIIIIVRIIGVCATAWNDQ